MSDRAAKIQADIPSRRWVFEHVSGGETGTVAGPGNARSALRQQSRNRLGCLIDWNAGENGGRGFPAECQRVVKRIEKARLNNQVRVHVRHTDGDALVGRDFVGDGRLEPVRLQRGAATGEAPNELALSRIALVKLGEISLQ